MGEARQRQNSKALLNALRPFAQFTHEHDPAKRKSHEIFVPTEGDVWFYVGKAEQVGEAHLHTNDFKRARELVLHSERTKDE